MILTRRFPLSAALAEECLGEDYAFAARRYSNSTFSCLRTNVAATTFALRPNPYLAATSRLAHLVSWLPSE